MGLGQPTNTAITIRVSLIGTNHVDSVASTSTELGSVGVDRGKDHITFLLSLDDIQDPTFLHLTYLEARGTDSWKKPVQSKRIQIYT